MTRTNAFPPGLLPLLLGGLLWFAGGPAAAAPAGPRGLVRTLEQGALEGVLVGLDETTLRMRPAGAAEDRAVPLTGVIDLHLPGGTAAARGAAPESGEIRLRAYLVGGETLLGVYRGPAGEGIELEVHGIGTLALSFEEVLSLERVPAKAPECNDMHLKYPRPESGDLAYDAGDDEFGGSVFEATNEALVLEDARGRQRTLPWKKLAVVHLENDPTALPEGLHAEVELVRGSRIAVAGSVLTTAKGFRFALRTQPKKQLEVPYSAVRAVRWSGGSFVYATTLPFESVLKRPYDDPPDVTFPEFYERFLGARVDRRSNGCPLRIGGTTYRHGFGVNSHSVLTIDLKGAFKTFQAGFGIDDNVLEEKGLPDKRGDVDARVLADGKELWKSSDARAGQPAQRIGPLDVSGVKQLVLEVGFGKGLTMRDRADWVEPILVRK